MEVRGVEWLKKWAASGGEKAQSKKEGSTENELKEVTNVDGGEGAFNVPDRAMS